MKITYRLTKKYISVCVFLFLGVVSLNAHSDYTKNPLAIAFIDDMVSSHQFSKADLVSLFSQANKQQKIIDAISRPAEKTLTWGQYRNIFLKPERIEKGAKFWQKHRATLEKAQQDFGVDVEVIVAILGVETRYGEVQGSYRVIDALSTLGFDYPPRAAFFRKELENFLLLAREQKQDPVSLTGSYAGAMGYGQFIPSSYRAYAVDYDQDGFADIWNNPVDAIGSIANYFKQHHWSTGEAVLVPAKYTGVDLNSLDTNKLKLEKTISTLSASNFVPNQTVDSDQHAIPLALEGDEGMEYYLGLKNFYVITRYNHSHLYAMAVYQLSQAIKQQM